MITKVTIVLFCASVAFAAQISHSENLGDKIDDLLKKLEDTVDNVAGLARKELNTAEAAVNRTALQIETTTKNSLKGLQTSFENKIDQLKATAKEAGVNADECFGQDEKTLVNLPTVTANDMVSCVQGYVNKIFADSNDALNKIQHAVDDVAEVKQSIAKCQKNVSCLEKLAVKIGDEIISLPADITRDVKDVKDIAVNVEAEIKKCGTDALSQCESTGKNLLTKISTCVAKKIGH